MPLETKTQNKPRAEDIRRAVAGGVPEEIPPGEIAPLPPAPRRPGRAPSLRGRLPKFSDERQRRAGKNLLRFFALLLVLTLVARGAAGATLPKVETERPQSADIVQRVLGTGTVGGAGSLNLSAPAGLTVKELLVSAGEKVAAGDAGAAFDTEEIQEQLQRQMAALEELELKLKQLERGEAHDGSALAGAQRALERAEQDYGTTVARADAEVAAAREALSSAESAAKKAKKAMEAIENTESEEYAAAKAAYEARKADVEAQKAAVSQAETAAQDNRLSATRALEDARAALESAQISNGEALTQAADTAAQNKIEAGTVRLDITAQQEKVDALTALLEAGGLLTAEKEGTVEALPETGSKTDEATRFTLTDESAGFEAEMWLDAKDAEKLSPGDLCEVAVSGGSMYYRPMVDGTVTNISAAGEDGRARVTIRLPEGDWKEGQTADIQVVQDSQFHNLCVPLSALRSDSSGYFVLILEEQSSVLGIENVAVKVPVTVKAQDDKMAAIEGPLSDRDNIISTASKAVEPGDKVRVVSE